MKIKLFPVLICLLLFFGANSAKASKVNGILDEYDLGTWGMLQHRSITHRIYQSIVDNKLTKYSVNGKPLSKSEVLKNFEQPAVAFISTDPDDPTKGYDTSFNFLSVEQLHSIILNTVDYEIKVNTNSEPIRFDGKELNALLNGEETLYLKYFNVSGKTEWTNIPETSRKITQSFNIKLLKESKKNTSIVYKSDSLKSIYSLKEKETIGNSEIVEFIMKDPNDPTYGIDSIYQIPLLETMENEKTYQFLIFLIRAENMNFNLTALSSGFQPNFFGVKGRPNPFGYIKLKEIKSLSPDEKQFICILISYSLQFNNKYLSDEYENYIKTFNIKSQRPRPLNALDEVIFKSDK